MLFPSLLRPGGTAFSVRKHCQMCRMSPEFRAMLESFLPWTVYYTQYLHYWWPEYSAWYRGVWAREKIRHQQRGGDWDRDCRGIGWDWYGGSRGQEDVRDCERGGGQPGPRGVWSGSDWQQITHQITLVAATMLASPIAAVRINVLLPSLLIASLVAAASLFCSGPYLLSVCLTSV